YLNTSSELSPEEDEGTFFSLINAPRYATSQYTSLYTDQIRELTKDLPELKANFSIVGMGGQTNSGIAVWAFNDWADRDRSQKEIQADIQQRIDKVAGAQVLIFAPPSLPGAGGGLPISIVVRSEEHTSELQSREN